MITGIGSLPGDDLDAAWSVVTDTCEELPFWPEVSSDMISRAVGLLSLPVAWDDGWRLASAPDGAARRARARWDEEIDAAAARLPRGSRVKIASCGPWTLAGQLRAPSPTMNHVVADSGACRELGEALAEGFAEIAARIEAACGVHVICQYDEPSISAILAGSLRTFSGLRRYRVPDRDEVVESWCKLSVGESWLHSCAPGLPVDLALRAGFDTIAVDAADGSILDELHGWLDEGRQLALGVVDTRVARAPRPDDIAERTLAWPAVEQFWERIVLTPACGMAGWELAEAGRCLVALSKASHIVSERLGARG